MKINSLLEGQTPSSSIANTTSSAPVFGRDDEHLEETTSGCIASVASPIGNVQRRGKGDIFSGIKTSKKFPNSKSVKESDLNHYKSKQKQDFDLEGEKTIGESEVEESYNDLQIGATVK